MNDLHQNSYHNSLDVQMNNISNREILINENDIQDFQRKLQEMKDQLLHLYTEKSTLSDQHNVSIARNAVLAHEIEKFKINVKNPSHTNIQISRTQYAALLAKNQGVEMALQKHTEHTIKERILFLKKQDFFI